MRRDLWGALAAGLAAVGLAASWAAHAADPTQPGAGRATYERYCYYCHGYAGDARTAAARVLDPPPRDFTATDPASVSRERMIASVRDGRPGTAMQAFSGLLDEAAIAAVVHYLRAEVMGAPARNARYHSRANGWSDSSAQSPAAAYVLGEVAFDAPQASLSDAHRTGRAIYLSTCVVCHPPAGGLGAPWRAEATSYPRGAYSHRAPLPDALSGATPYARHDRPPRIEIASPDALRGEGLFQSNCAFCHAADGSGRNWIGSFLDPRPRDLTDPHFMRDMTRARLAQVIRTGLPGTSMPAWQAVLSADEIAAIVTYVAAAFHPLAD